MLPILSSSQMRWADRHAIEHTGIPGKVLMAEAGHRVAETVMSRMHDIVKGRVLIVAGPGNNGGDGFAALPWLLKRKMNIQVILFGTLDQLKGDAALHAKAAVLNDIEITECPNRDILRGFKTAFNNTTLIVDAMFGTGLRRPLTGLMATGAELMNASPVPVLAVDLPSGINSDTGQVMGAAVKARWTLPIAAFKWGHWLNSGREHAGEILPPARIGISDETITEAGVKEKGPVRHAWIMGREVSRKASPERPRSSHKRDFGHAWIFGGSRGYTGAPRLAASGAFAAGAGLVSIACPEDVYPVVAASSLEVMVHPQDSAPWRQADAILAGPGWGRAQRAMLMELLAADMPLILDADALNMIAEDSGLRAGLVSRTGRTVITPHPGEAGRLLGISAGEVQSDRLAAALALAGMFQCWCTLKGSESLIANPQQDVWLCPFGSPKLSTAGTGDVLAGMIAALLGQGLKPEKALSAAVTLHALAGEQKGWYLAGELGKIIHRLRG